MDVGNDLSWRFSQCVFSVQEIVSVEDLLAVEATVKQAVFRKRDSEKILSEVGVV